jgi:hypothetical protein
MNMLSKLMPRGRWGIIRIAAVLGLAVAAIGPGAAPRARADVPISSQWQLRDTVQPFGTDVYPGYQYKLWNLENSNMLIKKNQRFGIDIDFVPDPHNGYEGIKFERKSGSGPLKFGEAFAIYVVGGGYLKYEAHNNLAELGYNPTPVYEWKFTGAPNGTPVKTGLALGLFNNRAGGYLFHYFMPVGVNLNIAADTPRPW